MFTYDVLFHLFCAIDTISHVPKSTRVNKIHILTRKSSLSEENFSPMRRNTLGNLLLDAMSDSPVCFKIITNNIFSNQIPHMVFPFLLVSLHFQETFQERERRRGQKATKKF